VCARVLVCIYVPSHKDVCESVELVAVHELVAVAGE